MTELNADVIGAFVSALARVLRVSLGETGETARFASLHVTRELEPPPAVAVTIEVTGGLRGPVTWVFSHDLAHLLAARMLMTEHVPADTVADAVAELSNIAAGNATGPLLDAGFQVDIAPPVVYDRVAHPQLPDDTLVATITAASGTVRVYLGLEVAA